MLEKRTEYDSVTKHAFEFECVSVSVSVCVCVPLTLLHELHGQAGAVGAHEGEHAHHHDEHPRAQHRRGHHQQLLGVGQQVRRGHLLQQVLDVETDTHKNNNNNQGGKPHKGGGRKENGRMHGMHSVV